MKAIARLSLLAIVSFFWTAPTASAQFSDGWWFLNFEDTTGAALQPLNIGIDPGDGSGFSFSTLLDDDGDGVIRLPPVPPGGRLALGVQHAGGEVGCDIWDLLGGDVVGGTEVQNPLLIIAEDVEGETLGVDYGDFIEPPFALTPGARYTVVDGRVAAWPEPRFVNDFGVPGLEEFVQTVDSLPNFSGEVIVTNVLLTGTLVPEPGSMALAALGLIGVTLARRNFVVHRRQRIGVVDAAK